MTTRGWRGWLVVAMVAGVALRLAFGLGYWRSKPLTHDEQEYLGLALNLAAGCGFVAEIAGGPEGPNAEHFARAPLYPALLSLVFRATGQSTARLPDAVPSSVKIVQSLSAVPLIALAAALARRSAGTHAGLIAAWLTAAYPPLAWFCAFALTEAIYAPLALAGVAALARITDPGDTPRHPGGAAALAGLLTGLSALARPASLAFVAVAAVWLVLRRRTLLAVLLAAAAALPVLPWTLRNYAVHGRIIAVAAEGGVTFWTGNHPLAQGEGDLAANPPIKQAQREFVARHPGLTPEELEPLYYKEALRFIVDRPLRWLWLEARKALYIWAPVGPSYRLHSPRYYGATLISYLPLLACAVAGLIGLWRRARVPVSLLLAAGAMVLVCLVFFPQERFRVPLLDPIYIVLASAGLGRRGSTA